VSIGLPLSDRPFYYAHFVYRIYGHHGALLYVGSTNDPRGRVRNHLTGQDWWMEVGAIGWECYPNKSLAEEAERRAIAEEGPRENIVHTVGLRRSCLPGTERFQLLTALRSFESGVSAKRLAREAGMSSRVVRDLLHELVEAGDVERTASDRHWKVTGRFSDVIDAFPDAAWCTPKSPTEHAANGIPARVDAATDQMLHEVPWGKSRQEVLADLNARVLAEIPPGRTRGHRRVRSLAAPWRGPLQGVPNTHPPPQGWEGSSRRSRRMDQMTRRALGDWAGGGAAGRFACTSIRAQARTIVRCGTRCHRHAGEA
jgi:predicted transcriptional regulator